jgi:hypothetical protein
MDRNLLLSLTDLAMFTLGVAFFAWLIWLPNASRERWRRPLFKQKRDQADVAEQDANLGESGIHPE